MKMCQNCEWPHRLVLPDAFCELHTFVPPKKRRQQNFFVPDDDDYTAMVNNSNEF